MQFTQLELVTPPVPVGSTELSVVFVPNRGGSMRTSMQLRASSSHGLWTAGRPGPEPNIALFQLVASMANDEQHIRVITEGDLPTPALYIFRRGPDSIAAAPREPPIPPGNPAFDFETATNVSPDKLAFGADFHAKGILKSVEGEPDPRIRRYREYFSTLEKASNPSLLPLRAPARQHVAAVMPTLRRRARSRAVHKQRGSSWAEAPLLSRPTEALRDSVRYLSGMQLVLIDEFFTASGMFNLVEFEEAYELFAAGRLRRKVPAPNLKHLGYFITQPSSAYYVFFAEFAFLAAECGLATDRWAELANVMTRTHCVYMSTYRPSTSAEVGFTDYRAENFSPAQQVATAEVASMRNDIGRGDMLGMYAVAGATAVEMMPKYARP